MREYFEWFELTHQLKTLGGAALWQRVALPATGGLVDQPAKLMEALGLLAATHNKLLRRARRSVSQE